MKFELYQFTNAVWLAKTGATCAEAAEAFTRLGLATKVLEFPKIGRWLRFKIWIAGIFQ